MSLEQLEKIAKGKADEIKKAKEDAAKAKAADQSKGGAASKDDEQKKTEGDKSVVQQAEAQAKEDERILTADEKTLSDAEKKRKDDLIKAKEAKETPDEKINRVKAESQKRIDEIMGELKATKHKSEEENKTLRAELDLLKKQINTPKDHEIKDASKKAEADRIAKYIVEDKSKPYHERREMTKEDLEEFLLEDLPGGQEWLVERNLRRRDEAAADADHSTRKQVADEFTTTQTKHADALFAKYPDIKTKDSDVSKLVNEIIQSDVKRYVEHVEGPKFVMDELDKRLAKKDEPKKTITLTEEELQAKIKAEADAEIKRRESVDEGINSTGGNGRKLDTKIKTTLTDDQKRVAIKAKIPLDKLEKVVARRGNIPGAGVFHRTGADGKKIDE